MWFLLVWKHTLYVINTWKWKFKMETWYNCNSNGPGRTWCIKWFLGYCCFCLLAVLGYFLFVFGREGYGLNSGKNCFVFLPSIIFKHPTTVKALNLTIPLSEISMVFPVEWEHLLWRSCGEEKVLRMLTSSASLRFSLDLRLSSLNTYPATIFRIRNAEGSLMVTQVTWFLASLSLSPWLAR